MKTTLLDNYIFSYTNHSEYIIDFMNIHYICKNDIDYLLFKHNTTIEKLSNFIKKCINNTLDEFGGIYNYSLIHNDSIITLIFKYKNENMEEIYSFNFIANEVDILNRRLSLLEKKIDYIMSILVNC